MTPIQQIKAAIRCDDYIGENIDVRRGIAICPFHQEKTASLRVHEDYFKCFGCSAGGDVITFAREFHGISTGDAIRLLAERAGVVLTPQPVKHPYDAAKDARIRAEAEEWRRQAHAALVSASHHCAGAHFDQIDPFRRMLESMSRQQVLSAYCEQRTVEQASLLRESIRESDLWVKAMTPVIERLLAS